MTALAKTNKSVSLGDRFAELAVTVLTLVALALGWLVKTGVENRAQDFTGGSIAARVPAGWLVEKPGEGVVMRASDRTTTGYGTTYLIRQQAVPADQSAGQFVSLLTMQRGSDLTAYRLLSQQEVLVGGRKAIQLEYVYVESAANLVHAVLPAVVHGLDYVFVNNGQAVIVTYHADQSLYETGLGRFQRFLVSVKY